MQTKLTLRLDEDLVRLAKAFARSSGKSVSRIVADYFALLGNENRNTDTTPAVRALRGALRGANEEDYGRYLEEKFL